MSVSQRWLEPAADLSVGDAVATPEPQLRFRTVREMRADAAARGPREWLVRGIITAGAYGVHAGTPKTQKTWNATDLAVSVATGTDWLGHFPVDVTGPVVMFAGEGGEGSILRRVDAVAQSKGVDPDALQLAICARAPHLSNLEHQAELRAALAHYKPSLVVLDPLYLSARGAKLTDLYEMGALLEVPQRLCQAVNASLLVVHHFNRNREGKGSDRFSGAGPAEWGRFLVGASVVSRYTDQATQETSVVTEMDVIGGEVVDQTFRVHRTIRAEDPDDLDSPLSYRVNVTTTEQEAPSVTTHPGAKPSAQRVLGVLVAAAEPLTVKQIGDRLADDGKPLRARTIQAALQELGDHVDGLKIDARGTTEWAAREVAA